MSKSRRETLLISIFGHGTIWTQNDLDTERFGPSTILPTLLLERNFANKYLWTLNDSSHPTVREKLC